LGWEKNPYKLQLTLQSERKGDRGDFFSSQRRGKTKKGNRDFESIMVRGQLN